MDLETGVAGYCAPLARYEYVPRIGRVLIAVAGTPPTQLRLGRTRSLESFKVWTDETKALFDLIRSSEKLL